MPLYNVKVIVEYEYEVECETEADAEEQGWNYEEYAHFASVYSIDVEHLQDLDDEDEDEDNEDEQSYRLSNNRSNNRNRIYVSVRRDSERFTKPIGRTQSNRI